MRPTHRTIASAARTSSFLAIFGLISFGVAQATGGSTDIYAPNGIISSLGTAAEQATALVITGSYGGSTDTWGPDGFRTSFGRGNLVSQSNNACGNGSTDIYASHGFLVSFGSPTSKSSVNLAQACGGAATFSR
jgi:hypothetical protein